MNHVMPSSTRLECSSGSVHPSREEPQLQPTTPPTVSAGWTPANQSATLRPPAFVLRKTICTTPSPACFRHPTTLPLSVAARKGPFWRARWDHVSGYALNSGRSSNGASCISTRAAYAASALPRARQKRSVTRATVASSATPEGARSAKARWRQDRNRFVDKIRQAVTEALSCPFFRGPFMERNSRSDPKRAPWALGRTHLLRH